MDLPPFEPITLPADWDEQKDCDHFDERWEPEPTYTAALWRMMRFHITRFLAALDSSLAYFQVKNPNLVQVEPMALSAREKIEILQECARSSPCAAHFRARLLGNLRDCETSERERERVLREYRQARDGAWMYPVIELVDYLGTAGSDLEETMRCGTDDFHAVMSRWRKERDKDYDF